MTRKRTAVIARRASAAGAVAAGAVGPHRDPAPTRARISRHALWELPPDDLGPVASFDGTELAVRAAGARDAPVLLFVHGFSLDMTTWHEQWVDLSVDFRCVLMDQRGHGRSGPRGARRPVAARDGPRHRAPCSRPSHPTGPRCSSATAWARWRSSRWPSSAPSCSAARGRRRARGRVVLATCCAARWVGHRPAAPAPRLLRRGGRARRPAPQGGAREPGRPAGRRRPAHPVRARCAPARRGPRRAPRRARVLGGLDRRPRRADGDGPAPRPAAR